MKLDRLFEIIYILLERERVTASTLAEYFGVSQRTIYRDVETLSVAGIPIYMNKGKGGGIALLPGFVLNKALLTESEKTDVLSSLKALSRVTPGDEDSALKKLGSLLGLAATDWIEVDYTSWQNPKNEADTFHMLKSAILAKRIVSFQYASGRGEMMTRVLEPMKLCFKGQAWYLFGFCRLRQDFRFCKLRRMRELTVSEESFERICPDMVIPEDGSKNMETVELTLRLPENMAFRVYDEFESYERSEDGGFIARVKMPSGDWAFSYVTSFGEQCEVLQPPELRAEVSEKLENILKLYR